MTPAQRAILVRTLFGLAWAIGVLVSVFLVVIATEPTEPEQTHYTVALAIMLGVPAAIIAGILVWIGRFLRAGGHVAKSRTRSETSRADDRSPSGR